MQLGSKVDRLYLKQAAELGASFTGTQDTKYKSYKGKTCRVKKACAKVLSRKLRPGNERRVRKTNRSYSKGKKSSVVSLEASQGGGDYTIIYRKAKVTRKFPGHFFLQVSLCSSGLLASSLGCFSCFLC